MKTFQEAVNWEYVHAHHKASDGKVMPGAWCKRIIDHAKRNGHAGTITEYGACRIINRNLW